MGGGDVSPLDLSSDVVDETLAAAPQAPTLCAKVATIVLCKVGPSDPTRTEIFHEVEEFNLNLWRDLAGSTT